MSNFREAEMPFPWIPILIVFCALILFALMARWGVQYASYLWSITASKSRHHSKKKRHKKHHKKAKYSDSSSESSEDSSD